ncbi:hypothetical protein ACLKA7_009978 [Drosophila subpalustris]
MLRALALSAPIYEYATPAGNAPCRHGASGTSNSCLIPHTSCLTKLLQCRKFLSHVYKKFNACTFHILCSLHHSMAQWVEAVHFSIKNMVD